MSIATKEKRSGTFTATIPGNNTPTTAGQFDVGPFVLANFVVQAHAIGSGGQTFFQESYVCVKGGGSPAFSSGGAGTATNPTHTFGSNAMMGSDFVGGAGGFSNLSFSFSGSNLVFTFTKYNAASADLWVTYDAYLLT